MFGRTVYVYEKRPEKLGKKWPKDDARATYIRVGRASARRFKKICRRLRLHPSRELTDFMKAWASGLYDPLTKFGVRCRKERKDPTGELERLVGEWFKRLANKSLRSNWAKNDIFRSRRKVLVSGGLPSLDFHARKWC